MKITPNIDQPQFTPVQVARASGVSVNTLRTWFARGLFVIGETDREAEGNGLPRLLSGRTAISVAITKVLVDGHISAKRAAEVSRCFAHGGSEDRAPGTLFSDGFTCLAVPLEGAARVFKLDDSVSLKSAFNLMGLKFFGGSRSPAMTVFELTEIVEQTRAALGLPHDGDDIHEEPERAPVRHSETA